MAQTASLATAPQRTERNPQHENCATVFLLSGSSARFQNGRIHNIFHNLDNTPPRSYMDTVIRMHRYGRSMVMNLLFHTRV